MLSLLKISQIALIDQLTVEFAEGLNLLTGETGSGKSIIVDSLGALVGERVSSDIIKENAESARVEGLFIIKANDDLANILKEGGFDVDGEYLELIIRREISRSGKNRIFVNDQLVTQSFLKKLGAFLVDIHGQGDQASLFDPSTHLEILDEYAGLDDLREKIQNVFAELTESSRELRDLEQSEAHKLQLMDILRFQIDEISKVKPEIGEEENLIEERKKLLNVEKLSQLSEQSYSLLYEDENAVVTSLEKVARQIAELAEYESGFKSYLEDLQNTIVTLEDLASTIRSFRVTLDFSPGRLEDIEARLAEISRLKRKYGGSVENVLKHLEEAEAKLLKLENTEIHQEELRKRVESLRVEYNKLAGQLHEARQHAAREFEEEVEKNLKKVALEKGRFKVVIERDESRLTAKGFDKVEFYFSANLGESLKPLVKVASGGEASRLMLVLKTVANLSENQKTMVFDEIDIGIGGRVAEAVGLKLRELAKHHQVLCVTHQPQVAALADHHFLVEKLIEDGKTKILIKKLNIDGRVQEIARMLAGEKVTLTAQKHAEELLRKGMAV
jgi:DNA repair protein RecN (Recombination protein N)